MRIWSWVMALTGGALLTAVAEENSAQRLENAQRGMAEPSWPRKPDNRLSPLSGKMKENREISVSYYGKDREIQPQAAGAWQKEARTERAVGWGEAAGHRWQKEDWGQGRDWVSAGAKSEKFQPDRNSSSKRVVAFRELEQEAAGDWSSRSARLGGSRDGSLRMYEGRLTRVREQVWQEEQTPRDLGPGRQERFSPEEVEEMLSRPLGKPRRVPQATEQSPAASPLAAADN